jgi:predicted RNase H-like HicB family nuclease
MHGPALMLAAAIRVVGAGSVMILSRHADPDRHRSHPAAEQGGYDVHVPALPGCVTQGDTYEEAVVMTQEAIEGFVEALALAGEPVPTEAI